MNILEIKGGKEEQSVELNVAIRNKSKFAFGLLR